jgi:hypothetical protein
MQPTWTTALYNARMQWNNVGNSNLYFYYSTSSGNTITLGRTDPGNGGETYNDPWVASNNPTFLNRCTTTVNQNYSWNTGTMQDCVTHELGHWLVLGDRYNSSESSYTMYKQLHTGMDTLELDDINGIKYIYKAKGQAPRSGT